MPATGTSILKYEQSTKPTLYRVLYRVVVSHANDLGSRIRLPPRRREGGGVGRGMWRFTRHSFLGGICTWFRLCVRSSVPDPWAPRPDELKASIRGTPAGFYSVPQVESRLWCCRCSTSSHLSNGPIDGHLHSRAPRLGTLPMYPA